MAGAAGWESPEGRRVPRGVLLVGLVLVGAAVAALAAGGEAEPGPLMVTEAAPSPDEPSLPDVTPTSTPTPATGERQPLAAGGAWEGLPPAPVDDPGAHHGVWTGHRDEGGLGLVVVGRGGAVVAFDPSDRVWHDLPSLPFNDVAADPVWVGGRLVAFAGETVGSGMAAVFEPGAAQWSLHAASVSGLAVFAAAGTGGEVARLGYQVDPDSDGPGPVAADAFDPATGAWRVLPSPPLLQFGAVAGADVRGEAVFWGRHTGEATQQGGREHFLVRYQPDADRWVVGAEPTLHDPAYAAAVSTGEDLLLWGQPEAGHGVNQPPPAGASYTPGGFGWAALPRYPGAVPRHEDRYGFAATWTDGWFVVVGGYPRSVAIAYEPGTGTWMELPALGGLVHPVLAWTGEELLLWGGYGTGGSTVDLRAWRPAPGPWIQRRFRRGDLLLF